MDSLRSPLRCPNTPDATPKRTFHGYIGSPATPGNHNAAQYGKKCQLGQGVNIDDIKAGMAVYCRNPDNNLWVKGQVAEITAGDIITIMTPHGEIKVSGQSVALQCLDQNLHSITDLTKISPLSTPAVVECLEQRYKDDEIYTGAGSTLVVINPYKPCPWLYGDQAITLYSHGTQRAHQQTNVPLAPHIYQTADAALRGLSYGLGKHNHSLIVSGESGAGKTVSAKHVMKYLVTVANKDTSSDDIGSRIEQRILDSNPILEAFGNASTLRNHNSSRFGKYIQLQFNRYEQIEGATIQTYLLEKTRVTHQSSGECNFHIFYQLLSASSERDVAAILDGHQFTLPGTESRDTQTDLTNWRQVQAAFTHMGFSTNTRRDICKVLCALLHLTNIQLTEDPDDDDITVFTPGSNEGVSVACNNLGVDCDKLEKTLTHKRIAASHRRRQSVFYRPCTVDQAERRRDCLSKLIYARLFEWLVDMINHNVAAPNTHRNIGILDIYGFESFQDNSLEQLCINYANEKLQQHYVMHFLKDLQTDYAREAIPWTFTEFSDNRECVDILECNPGLFSLIDEECQLNRVCNDEDLCSRVLSTMVNQHITRAKRSNTHFVIKHYAEPVQYNMEGIVDKNKDDIPGEVVELLQESREPFLSDLFCDMETSQPSGGKKKKCVLTKFKASLDSLMLTLEHTEPHYVRCIKPNQLCEAGRLDQLYVLSQLQACGIIETVEISRQAFPARLSYEEFLQRYGLLLHAKQLPAERRPDHQEIRTNKENELLFEPLDLLYRKQLNMSDRRKSSTTPKKKLRRRAGLSSADHTRKLSASIMCMVFGSAYTDQPTCSQFGKTKLFLKSGQMERLESERTLVLSTHAFTIQCAWRRHLANKRRRRVEAIIRIQAVIRSWLVRVDCRHQQRAAVIIQRAYRRHMLACLHQQVAAADPAFSTPCQTIDDEHSVISCGSPRIGAIVSQACMEEARRLDSSPHTIHTSDTGSNTHIPDTHTLGTPNTNTHNTPFYTPVTSRKPCRLHDDFDQLPPRVEQLRFDSTPCYPDESPKQYVVKTECGGDRLTYHIMRSPHPAYPGSQPMADIFRSVGSAIATAFLTHERFTLAGAFTGIPYFEAHRGIVSRRRLPRVQIKFHTRVNALLKYGHYIHQKELQCSITDCLNVEEIMSARLPPKRIL